MDILFVRFNTRNVNHVTINSDHFVTADELFLKHLAFYEVEHSTILAWLEHIKSVIKREMKLFIQSRTSTVQPLMFENGWVISSHTLLGMRLRIHNKIKANLF